MLVIDIFRVLGAIVLIAASILKLAEGPEGFAQQIRTFRVVPEPLIQIVAKVLPPLELCIGLMVLVDHAGPWKIAALGVLLIYTLAIGQALVRRIPSNCGCFGKLSTREANPGLVVRNVVFMALLLPSTIALPFGQAGWGIVSIVIVLATAAATLAGRRYTLRRRHRAAMGSHPAAPGHDHAHVTS